MKTLKLRCICRPTDYDIPKTMAEAVRANFRIRKTYFADLVTGDPGRWSERWTLRQFDMPFIAMRDKEKPYYYVPGVPGLWFSDKPAPLEVRDTRRSSDWDKLKDKRVVRRMYRQMAKSFAGSTDLKSARNHKR